MSSYRTIYGYSTYLKHSTCAQMLNIIYCIGDTVVFKESLNFYLICILLCDVKENLVILDYVMLIWFTYFVAERQASSGNNYLEMQWRLVAVTAAITFTEIEWCMNRCVSKNRYQKRDVVTSIELNLRNFVDHSYLWNFISIQGMLQISVWWNLASPSTFTDRPKFRIRKLELNSMANRKICHWRSIHLVWKLAWLCPPLRDCPPPSPPLPKPSLGGSYVGLIWSIFRDQYLSALCQSLKLQIAAKKRCKDHLYNRAIPKVKQMKPSFCSLFLQPP